MFDTIFAVIYILINHTDYRLGDYPLIPSQATQLRIAELRQKARDGTLTLEETKEGISFLRAERLAMPPSKSTGTRKAAVDVDALLGDLGI